MIDPFYPLKVAFTCEAKVSDCSVLAVSLSRNRRDESPRPPPANRGGGQSAVPPPEFTFLVLVLSRAFPSCESQHISIKTKLQCFAMYHPLVYLCHRNTPCVSTLFIWVPNILLTGKGAESDQSCPHKNGHQGEL